MEMKNFRNISLIALLIIASFCSCKKSSDDFVPYNNSDFSDTEWTNSTMSNLKSQAIVTALSKSPVTATLSALSANTVDMNSSTQLFVPANACTLNGVNYSGNITANLNSVLTKGDFIRNMISSCNENSLQETVAAFDLNLYSAAKETLGFKQQNKFSLAFADTNFPGVGYKYYYGSMNQGIINWTLADSLTGSLSYNQVSIQGTSKPAYQISSNKLSWMTINRPVSLGSPATCNILLPINFTNKNTAVFAVFRNNNIVIRLNGDAASKSFVATNLPANADVTFVALSYLDNQFYLGYLETLITNNTQYNIKTTTTPISLSSLNSFLDGL
jgi:hypothetical protein